MQSTYASVSETGSFKTAIKFSNSPDSVNSEKKGCPALQLPESGVTTFSSTLIKKVRIQIRDSNIKIDLQKEKSVSVQCDAFKETKHFAE